MKKYLFSFILVAGLCFYFFNTKNSVDEQEYSHNNEQALEESLEQAEQDVIQEKIKEEPFFPDNNAAIEVFSSRSNIVDKSKLKFTIKKKYNHEITNADIKDLLKFDTTTDNFLNGIELLSRDLKSSDFTNNAIIDLSVLPESNDQKNIWFQGFSTVIQQKLFAEITKDKKDYNKITNHLLAVQVVDFLSAMNFGGYTKDGAFIYEISDNLLASNLTKFKKRKVASQTKPGLFNFSAEKRLLSPEKEEALIGLKSEQTLYGDDLSGHKRRDAIAVQDDPRTTKYFELLESNLFSKLGNFGAAVTTNDYHQNNMALLHSLPKMASKDPAAFGLRKGEGSSINLTDVGFNQLLHMIISSKSLWSAGISGALSTIIDGDVLKFMFTKAPIIFAKFKLVLTLGVEPVIMSYLIYQGMKQSYVLHRFYSYMIGAKQANAINNPGTDFPYYEAVSNFDPSKVIFDEYFRRETIRALTVSYTTGVLIRNFVTLKRAKQFTNLISGMNVVQSAVGKGKKAASATRAGRLVNQKLQSRNSIKNPDKYLQALLGGVSTEVHGKDNTDNKESPEDDKKEKRKRKKLKKKMAKSAKQVAGILGKVAMMGPAKLIDFMITAPTIYVATYRILSSATLSMTKTDLSPGASIQRSLFSGISGDPKFVHGTRNVLYPLCRYLSHYNKIEIETARHKDSRQKRQRACLKLIKNIEGYTVAEDMLDDLNNKMPNSNIDFNNIYHALTTEEIATMDRNELDDILQESFNYPVEFRITWLSALRSIFGLTHIPRSYREVQHSLIIKKVRPGAWDLSSSGQVYLILNEEVAAYRNIYRLNYTTELLAVDIYRYNNKTARSLMNRTDPRIAKNTDDLVDAWIEYVSFQKDKVIDINELLNIEAEGSTEESTAAKLFSWARNHAGKINEVRKGITSGGSHWNMTNIAKKEISAVRKK